MPAYVDGSAGISSTRDWLATDRLGGECGAEMLGDELAVEATVFDEDFVGTLARDYDSGEIDSGDVTLECRGVADGAAVVAFVEGDAEAFDKAEVRMIAGERENEVVR